MQNDDHPIRIEPSAKSVTVTVAGQRLAETRDALLLHEASHAPVYYIPRQDVNFDRLSRSTHTSYCPYKGTASYYHLSLDSGQVDNAVWSYEQPYPAVAQIEGYLAFYPSKVTIAVE